MRALLIFFFTYFLTINVFAKTLTLYDTNKPDAKSIATLDTETGLIPIFVSEDAAWVKVGNPENGDTGWVKAGDLSFQNTIIGFVFSNVGFDASVPDTKYVLKLGQSQNLTGQQAVDYFKQLHEQQGALQNAIQQLVNILTAGNSTLNMPVMMPILFIPEKKLPMPLPMNR
jgi:hypothetical protein